MAFYACAATSANAEAVTTELEAFTVTGTTGFQTVTFAQSYANPVPVCIYNLPAVASPFTTPAPAAVRINALSPGSMQIKLQRLTDAESYPNPGDYTTGVASAPVHCIVAEAGVHMLPDGTQFSAGKLTSDRTHGQNAADRWIQSRYETVPTPPASFSDSLVALAQVVTYRDVKPSVIVTSNCAARGDRPYAGGRTGGFCVSKQISRLGDPLRIYGNNNNRRDATRNNEMIGYIVFEQASGSFINPTMPDVGVQYRSSRGADGVVAGVNGSPPYSYSTTEQYDIAVGTQGGEAGGNGSWAVMYGGAPLAGASIDFALDEDIDASTNIDRAHTQEPVDWIAFKFSTPEFTIEKTVDEISVDALQTLTYSIEVENTGAVDLSGVSISDDLVQGATALTLTTGDPLTPDADTGTVGVLDVGETWTYTLTYDLEQANLDDGQDIVNTAEVSFAGLDPQTDDATTEIEQTPLMDLVKTHAFTTEIVADGQAQAGEVITYTYTVSNTGNVTINGVSVADVHNGLGGNLTLTASSTTTNGEPYSGSVLPGDSIELTANYTVTQQDVDELQ